MPLGLVECLIRKYSNILLYYPPRKYPNFKIFVSKPSWLEYLVIQSNLTIWLLGHSCTADFTDFACNFMNSPVNSTEKSFKLYVWNFSSKFIATFLTDSANHNHIFICSVAKARVRPSKRIWLLKDPIKEACLTNWTKSFTLTVNQLSKYEYFIKINWFCPYLGLGCCLLCYHSCPRVKGCYFPIRVFICICPSTVSGNFVPMGFPVRIKKGEKQKFCSTFAF